MKQFAIIFCCFLFALPPLVSWANESGPTRHLFIEWQHWDSTIVLGTFTADGKKDIQSKLPLRNIDKKMIENWLQPGDGAILLLFHCMWGQQRLFHNKYLAAIDRITKEQPPNGIHTEISFIWHAGGVLYRKNWKEAADKGEPLGKIVAWISDLYHDNTHVFCHSMGNRFFEGVCRNIPPGKSFKTLTLFSADIEGSTTDKDLIHCVDLFQSVYVYMHQKDRLLLASSLLTGSSRMGRTGPHPLNDAFEVVDMTNHAWSFSNHSHFENAWVIEQLSRQYR